MELMLAVVTAIEADRCVVDPVGARAPVPAGYLAQFRPRAESLAPGHLVACVPGAGTLDVAWRWFPATVVAVEGDRFTLDEPFHGRITAVRRNGLQPAPAPGATVFAGLGLVPEWRIDAVAGPDGEPEQPAALAASTFEEIRELYRRLAG